MAKKTKQKNYMLNYIILIIACGISYFLGGLGAIIGHRWLSISIIIVAALGALSINLNNR